MPEYRYDFHGMTLQITTNSTDIADAVHSLLRHFPPAGSRQGRCLEVGLQAVPDRAAIPIRVSPAARVLLSQTGKAVGDLLRAEWKCTVYRESRRTICDFHAQGLLCIDPQQGQVEGYLVRPEAMRLDIRMSFFHFALTELLKREGLYTIHATALEKEGQGILIPGYSGQGKTTCCISLLRAGYRYLSDDHPLLRSQGARLELLSFPVKIDVTEQTIRMFPELQQAQEKLYSGTQKRYFYPEDFYPQAPVERCAPRLLLFPQVMDWPRSRLEVFPKSRALEELLPHSLLILDKEVARHQFQILTRLVQQADCYRLYFGEDVQALPRLLAHLWEQRA
ncbi:MAG: hypothetical protein D6736_00130 [Nitrospinota bacterium]|nr:MAG: hypothetical protein D6736_00130 [Nitrospinota bacterium]